MLVRDIFWSDQAMVVSSRLELEKDVDTREAAVASIRVNVPPQCVPSMPLGA